MANWYIPAAVVFAWVISHVTKEIIHYTRRGEFSWYTLLMETGGMPSSHSAAVSSLAAAVWYTEGFTMLFWVTLVFALIIIRDAFGQAGGGRVRPGLSREAPAAR